MHCDAVPRVRALVRGAGRARAKLLCSSRRMASGALWLESHQRKGETTSRQANDR